MEGCLPALAMNPWESTVIIVEDDPEEAFLLRRAFERANVKNPIQVFQDGQEVIDYLGKLESHPGKAFTEAPPGLMLLDLKLPRRTGFEVLEWLRRRARLRSLVVVVLANSLQTSDINRAYALGCNSYLAKPGNADQMTEMVRLIHNYWLLLNINPDLNYLPNPFP